MSMKIKKYLISTLICVAAFSAIWWLMALASITYDLNLWGFFTYPEFFRHPRLVGVSAGVVMFAIVGYLNKFAGVLDVAFFPAVAVVLNQVFTHVSAVIWHTDKVYTEWELGFWPDRLMFISRYLIWTCAIFLAVDRLLPFAREYLRAAVLGFVFILFAWWLMDLVGVITNILQFEIIGNLLFGFFDDVLFLPVLIYFAYGIAGCHVIKKTKFLKGFAQYGIFVVAAFFTNNQFTNFGGLGALFAAMYIMIAIAIFCVTAFISYWRNSI